MSALTESTPSRQSLAPLKNAQRKDDRINQKFAFTPAPPLT